MGLNSPWQTTREIHKFQNNQWILDVGRLQDDQYNRVSILIGNEFFIYGRNGGEVSFSLIDYIFQTKNYFCILRPTEIWNVETGGDTGKIINGNNFGLNLNRPALFGVMSDFCQSTN